MTGKHRITVYNKRIKYELEVRRNITILCGNSATGKTELMSLINSYELEGKGSGVTLICDKECRVIEGRQWRSTLESIENSIIFIDEGNSFVKSKEFAEAIEHSSNYFVIATRESLKDIPYSIHEIYGLREKGKYGTAKQVYNEAYNIYSANRTEQTFIPDEVITEDSNSGHQFFKDVCTEVGKECITAHGNSSIKGMLCSGDRKKLVIADGAAFGCEMRAVAEILKHRTNCALYLPESFEWMVLASGIIKSKEIEKILSNTYDYVESSQFRSWERFFTHKLTELTQDNDGLKYSKKKINKGYLKEGNKEKILNVMKHIDIRN